MLRKMIGKKIYIFPITIILFMVLVGLIVLYYTALSSYEMMTDERITKHKFTENDYEIWEIDGVLSKQECKDLITYAQAKGLTNSEVVSADYSQNVQNPDWRTSKQVWIQYDENAIAKKLSEYSVRLTGLPAGNQELLQVAKYDANGMFKDHHDACIYDNEEKCKFMNRNAGQRKTTFLVYLNDDFDGGYTEFPSVGFKCKPIAGKAILFWNVDENEKVIPQSLHRGNKVVNGEKWIATVWSHVKGFV